LLAASELAVMRRTITTVKEGDWLPIDGGLGELYLAVGEVVVDRQQTPSRAL
jgi:hypothetical protein